MIISMITVSSKHRETGGEAAAWRIPRVLAQFKSIIMGHTVLIESKTFKTIGRALSGRTIVLTRNGAQNEGYLVARYLLEAIAIAEGDEEIFICGDADLIREALPFCQKIYLTIVDGGYQDEFLFPSISDCFLECQREDLPDNFPPLSFHVFEKMGRIGLGADLRELCRKGNEAIQRKLFYLARNCFEQALSLCESAEIASDLALCRAEIGGDTPAALRMAEHALQSEPDNLHCRFNLGRVQILAGQREQGVTTFRRGVVLGGGKEFLIELERNRTPPPIRPLPRNHPLNRYLGRLLHRMGHRRSNCTDQPEEI
jgi:dihydrofolate reductase